MSKTTRHNNNTNNSNNTTTTNNTNNNDDDGDESECFYESLDRIASSSCSCSNSNSNSDNENDAVSVSSPNYGSDLHRKSFRAPKFPMGLSSNYDIWISEPSSVSERRSRLLRQMGLINDPSLSRTTRSISSDRLASQPDPTTSDATAATIVRSKSDGTDRAYDLSSPPPILSIHSSSSSSSSSSFSFVHNSNGNNGISNCSTSGGGGGGSKSKSSSPYKPPAIRKSSASEEIDDEGLDCEKEREKVCFIKNLDNGKEFVVNEIREDGMWNKVKEVETGRQLTMEEFQMSLGHSPIVQELMRRQNVEDGNKDGLDSNSNSNTGAAAAKMKKKGGWFKTIRNVASSVTGYKERRSSDERDTSSEKGGGGGGGGGGGRRSSSATDDSQDVSYHGPERVRVRQYGKSCKELSGLYKSQEIQAHNGSIWSIKFSLDGKYLASAGEDCDIHVWQVGETERKGDLLSMERQEDVNFNYLFVPNGSPEPNSLSPIMDSHLEKKKRGRTSVSRKSLSLDHIAVPDAVFALSDKPICSLQGHSDDVLDLSWSKSQHLLSSSMDKTVRLWHLPSKSCLKVFSHSDFVTCIQFNPVDDRYFISGSLDAKVRIWSIPDRQVVDWNDVHEMVTAACYTPDGQGALVGSHKGSCRLYNTSGTSLESSMCVHENKLQQKSQINLQNKKKKSHHKKISGFQFAPGSSSEVFITSADSRIRVVDGIDLVHKFKGFRNTNSQISASLTANGKYVVSASEDSYVYVWKHEADSRPSRSKGVTVTRSYELFHCQDVSVAIPWPGMADTWGLQDDCCVEQNGLDNNLDEVSTANHPPTPVEDINDGSRSASGCTNSPLHGTISSATNSYFFDRISATWPEEKLVPTTRNRSSPRVSVDGLTQNMSAWGMVIVTAGRKGQIRTFQNFGFPVRI